MSHVSWRDHIRPLIAGVLARTRQLNEAEVRRALRAARPSEYRLTSWGRKCWQREVREQLDALQRGREYLGEGGGSPVLRQPDNLPCRWTRRRRR